ncbi:MAG: SemiSWEET transporter [Bacteroidia bacterium]|nr:SemiSWEET transporter [Bacteroidia bacterium]
MDFGFWIGNIAAFLTTSSFLPQVIMIVRTRDTKAISLPMYVVMVIGISSWLVYGLLYELFPLIICNSITLVLTLTILIFKLKEPSRQNEV